MKLSVMLLTYNHASYIEQAVRSVLMQQTAFPFELVIGEDCSTDATSQIVRRLEAEHPGRIRVLRRDRNLGMQANFIDSYHQCQGDYLAYLDGDDYWVSPDKLQKQVDFLDQHTDYSFCFHNVAVLGNLRENLAKEHGAVGESFDGRSIFQLHDLLTSNFVPSCSVVARHRLIPSFPNWVLDIHGIDWIFNLLNVRRGSFGLVPGTMATYRKHAGGVWSSRSPAANNKTILQIYRAIKGELPRWTWPLIDAQIQNMELRSVVLSLMEERDRLRLEWRLLETSRGWRLLQSLRKLRHVLWPGQASGSRGTPEEAKFEARRRNHVRTIA